MAKNKDKTKEQMINELAEMQRRLAALEASEVEHEKMAESSHVNEEIIANMIEGVYLIGADDKIIRSANPKFEAMFGYGPGELIGKHVSVVNAPTDKSPEQTAAAIKGQLDRTGEWHGEVKNIKKDGTPFWGYANVYAFDHNKYGKVYISVHTDITERVKMEEDIQRSEKLYRSLFENMLNGFAYCRMLFEHSKPVDWVYLAVNSAFETLTGLKDVIGRKVSEVIPGLQESNPELFEIYGRVALTGTPEKFETYLPAMDMWFSGSVYSPEKEYFVVIFDVITEHKRADEQLKIAEQNFRNSLDDSPLGIRIITAEGELLYANKAILDIFGCSMEELRTTPARQRYTSQSYIEHRQRWELRDAGKPAPSNYEISIVRNDEGIRHLAVSRKEVIWNGEIQFQTLYQDITESKRAEEEIIRFKAVSDLATYGITMLDNERRITYTNKTCADLHGYTQEELIGQHCTLLVPENQVATVEVLFEKSEKTGGFTNEEIVHKRKDGTTFPALMTGVTVKDETGQPLYTSIVFIDITEQKNMQAQLMVTDRLASIGELAAGIAHEINNPLTSVIGFSDLIMSKKDIPEDIKEELAIINKEAIRASQVARHLLTFSRKHPEEKQPVDINKIIELVLELRAYEQKVHNIEVKTRLSRDIPPVLANEFQLQQVFVNIIINAEHFMLEAHGQGILTITTEQAGNIIRASFADDGSGITPEQLRRIFNPFYTTKEVGKGTGLGLSICYGIIDEHGGRVWAESEPGKGATFIIELPVYKG